jgi:hypothetical protein
MRLLELREQLRLLGGRNADTGVPHGEAESTGGTVALDADPHGPLIGKADGVAEQVQQDLPHQTGVGIDALRHARVAEHRELEALRAGAGGEQIHGALHDRLGIGRARGRLDAAALDLREVQHAVDDGQERPGGLAGGGGVVALLRIEVGFEQQLVHIQDGVQRRADLVAHGREEAALRLVGDVGALDALLQQRLLPAPLGQVAQDKGPHAPLRRAPGDDGDLDGQAPSAGSHQVQLTTLRCGRVLGRVEQQRPRLGGKPLQARAAPERLAAERCGRGTEQALGGGVQVEHETRGIQGNDAVRRCGQPRPGVLARHRRDGRRKAVQPLMQAQATAPAGRSNQRQHGAQQPWPAAGRGPARDSGRGTSVALRRSGMAGSMRPGGDLSPMPG